MSYSIHYGPDVPQSVPIKRSYFGLVGALLVVVICATAVGWAMPQQAEKFAQALFPWTRSEVNAAFAELREDVREGQPISEAVTTFCREIIDDADQEE